MSMDKRTRQKLLGRSLAAVVLLAAIGFIALGFMPKPVPVSVGNVEKRTLTAYVEEAGKTRIRTRYTVSSPVFGNLERIQLRAGDPVTTDSVVAQITPVTPSLLDARSRTEAEARVRVSQDNISRAAAAMHRAEAARNFAREQAARLRSLRAQAGASQQALDQAELDLRSAEEELASANHGRHIAESELAIARAALSPATGRGEAGENTVRLTSPVAGQILRVLQENDGVVQPGTPLLEVGDPRDLEVVVDVLSTEAVGVVPSALAEIERWGGTYSLSARVRMKEPSAFTTRSALGVEEQRVPVVLDLLDPPERRTGLSDGYRVEAHIRTESAEAALVMPASAVFRDGEKSAAFALVAGHARKVEVTLGLRTPDWVEVKRGVREGETVVLYPSDQVREGVALEVAVANGR
jgi:HlyD family secretion protein